MTDLAAAFSQAFRARAPDFAIREEQPDDHAFVLRLSCAGSAMADVLPAPLLEMQARQQIDAHNHAYPDGTQLLVCDASGPIARLFFDFSGAEAVVAVDIAILPDRRGAGIGTHLLATLLELADREARPCQLEVLRDNPARRLYERLGFRVTDDDGGPVLAMERPRQP